MMETRPLAPGPTKIFCPCAERCGRFGTPRKKLWRGEAIGHVRECPCRRCQGSRAKSRASARERRIASKRGLSRAPLSGAISGSDFAGGACLEEETAEEAVVRGIRRWLGTKTVTAKFQRLYSLPRAKPKARILSWNGKPQAVVLDYQDYEELEQLARLTPAPPPSPPSNPTGTALLDICPDCRAGAE